ncbi:hypothetical protein COCNU_scaffold005955G000010 [Cocos nucifera]|nr:hypothetical protein [Cocos nucifera]
MGISQVDPEGTNPSLSKVLGLKILWKRKVEMTSSKSAHARVEFLPTPPTSEIEKSDPHAIDDFKIVHVQHDLGSPVLEKGQRGLVECLFSQVILSLLAPNISDLFLEEEPTEAAGTFGTTPAGVQLQAFALEDYDLACIKETLKVEVEELKAEVLEKEASKENEDEKAEFTVGTYDEGKHFVRSGVASSYLELNLNSLDEVPEVIDADMAGAPIDPENDS